MTSNEKTYQVYQYILDSIQNSDSNEPFKSALDKVNFAYEQFKSEAWHEYNIKRFKGSEQLCFTDFIQGLPSWFNIDFTNYDILQLAIKWEYLKPDAKAYEENKFLENWYRVTTYRFFQLKERLERNSKTVAGLKF